MTRRFKFNLLFILLALFIVGAPMALMYTTSYKIADLNKQKLALEAEASDARNAIRVLQAEWAYLAEPARIERLAAAHLKMEKGKTMLLASASDLNGVLAAGREPQTANRQLAAAAPAQPAAVSITPAPRVTLASSSPRSSVRSSPSTPDTVRLVLASFRAQ